LWALFILLNNEVLHDAGCPGSKLIYAQQTADN